VELCLVITAVNTLKFTCLPNRLNASGKPPAALYYDISHKAAVRSFIAVKTSNLTRVIDLFHFTLPSRSDIRKMNELLASIDYRIHG
jgi:hypothetical protein